MPTPCCSTATGALWLADPATVGLTPVATVDPARRIATVAAG